MTGFSTRHRIGMCMRDVSTPSFGPDISKPWIALQVRSKMERTAAEHLRARGYELFVPLGPTCPAERRRTSLPLFPGYVFCRFDPTLSARIVTAPGVIRLVGFGDGPARISDEEIENVRRAVESGYPVHPLAKFTRGTKVWIASGPLRGVSGTVLKSDDQHFLVVEIALLQRAVAVQLDVTAISAHPTGEVAGV